MRHQPNHVEQQQHYAVHSPKKKTDAKKYCKKNSSCCFGMFFLDLMTSHFKNAPDLIIQLPRDCSRKKNYQLLSTNLYIEDSRISVYATVI